MSKKREQKKDINLYTKLIHQCKKRSWLYNTPVRYLERLFFRSHQNLRTGTYFDTIMAQLGVKPKHSLSFYNQELADDNLLQDTFSKAAAGQDNDYFDEIRAGKLKTEGYVANYYALVREIKPKIVLETGTATGSLTRWILSAMAKNNQGKLISVDLPVKNGDLGMAIPLQPDEVGILIPQDYRDRWEYHPGDAKELLPRLLLENNVDIFIHDSLHTRTHMLFEYNCARAIMRPNTIIMSHDILWNKAFFAFVGSHNLKSFSSIHSPNLGLTINRFEPYEEEIGLDVVQSEWNSFKSI